jgi:hypothetical protein
MKTTVAQFMHLKLARVPVVIVGTIFARKKHIGLHTYSFGGSAKAETDRAVFVHNGRGEYDL